MSWKSLGQKQIDEIQKMIDEYLVYVTFEQVVPLSGMLAENGLSDCQGVLASVEKETKLRAAHLVFTERYRSTGSFLQETMP